MTTIEKSQVDNIRELFKRYLHESNPTWSESTVSTHWSDAFYAYNNDIGIDFFSCFVSDQSLLFAKEKIAQYLANRKGSNNAAMRADGYYNDMLRFKVFLDERYPNLALEWQNKIITDVDNKIMYDIKRSSANFLKWFSPLIQALKDLGGSATPEEARRKIAENLNLSDDLLNEVRGKNKSLKYDNEVAWARNYLAYENIIDKSKRGIWALTDTSYSVDMTDELASEIFLKWVDILKERRLKKANSIGESENKIYKKKFWIYAPGESSRLWDEFYQKGIMGIGWDEIGDLSLFDTKEEMKEQMRAVYGDDASYMNAGHATWQFVNDIQIGDVVFVKKGFHKIIGRGIVTSDYIYDESRDEYLNIREMNWTHHGEWEHETQIVMKTLTDITPYTDYYKKIENMFIKSDDEPTEINEKVIVYKTYTDIDFLDDVYMDESRYNTLKGLLLNKKNLILQGAPGVGKTYAAERLAYSIMGEKDTSRVRIVQFHQSYSYEDFMMGYRPDGNGFSLAKGPFYEFCKEAEPDDRPYFFIIDEINRGNLSKIFGELLMLIESDKRGEGHAMRLLYSDEQFSVPSNVYIIGMMNTADRSLAMIDYALRRRFAFFEFEPAFLSVGFKKYQAEIDNNKFNALISVVLDLNNDISKDELLGNGFRIGHSYFCTKQEVDDEWLTSVVEYELLPLIKEYWFDEPTKVENWVKRLRGAIYGW